MAASGGALEHITIGDRRFTVSGDSAVKRRLGGRTKEVKANGDGATARSISTTVPWQLSDVIVAVDDVAGDHEYLQSVADSLEDVAITAYYPSGVRYTGTGTIVGEFMHDTGEATATLTLEGPGKLRKQGG